MSLGGKILCGLAWLGKLLPPPPYDHHHVEYQVEYQHGISSCGISTLPESHPGMRGSYEASVTRFPGASWVTQGQASSFQNHKSGV